MRSVCIRSFSGCYNLKVKIVSVTGKSYRIHFFGMDKNEAVNKLKNTKRNKLVLQEKVV